MVETYYDLSCCMDRQNEIRAFLRANADNESCAHFHWGRFAWMMAHPDLDTDKLSKIALFRAENGTLVGVALFDTAFENRWFMIHSIADEKLFREMIEYAAQIDGDAVTLKVNRKDFALCGLLRNLGFASHHAESVLEINLSNITVPSLPCGFCFNEPNGVISELQWRTVLHRGFGGVGVPKVPTDDIRIAEKQLMSPEYNKTFVICGEEYTAFCGVWYGGGRTAYIEPVATVPECRRMGLGRAVVLEGMRRVREKGAERAIVISDSEFYYKIGMTLLSEVLTWSKT